MILKGSKWITLIKYNVYQWQMGNDYICISIWDLSKVGNYIFAVVAIILRS